MLSGLFRRRNMSLKYTKLGTAVQVERYKTQIGQMEATVQDAKKALRMQSKAQNLKAKVQHSDLASIMLPHKPALCFQVRKANRREAYSYSLRVCLYLGLIPGSSIQ